MGLLTDSSISKEDFNANLMEWIDYHKSSGEKNWLARTAAGLRLLESLGYIIPDNAWWQILESTKLTEVKRSHPGLRAAIVRAATAGRKAETIMLILLRFGETGPDLLDIEAIADAVMAMRTIGLETEAKQLVLELAATAGL
jgi:hypothetical protein